MLCKPYIIGFYCSSYLNGRLALKVLIQRVCYHCGGLTIGGLTIFMHDDLFLKWKVTIINGVFAIALLISQYIFKKNLIKGFLSEALTLPEPIWSKLNLSWAIFFTFCGGLNLYIAFNFKSDCQLS